MSALWRVNLWASACFALLTLACAGLLLRQAADDMAGEVQSTEALQPWLGLCALALLFSLLSIGWAVRRGRAWLDEVLHALAQVSDRQMAVRLGPAVLPETRQLAEHFKRMASALEQARADNQQLTQALLAVQEQERNHLAQTLHDDLGQYLAGIRAQACLLRLVVDQPALVASTAQSLEHNCEQLQQGFRAMVQDLYPVVLDHLPLAEALGSLAQQWQARQGIECRLRVGEHLPALSGASKTHLYRLLQEALTNVARHAGASQVRVRLQRGGTGLRLLIRDNGRGAPQARRAGVGLHSMAERARHLGGELRVINCPGAGWALALSIPLEAG